MTGLATWVVVVSAGACALLPGIAVAYDEHSTQWGTSTDPYWKVGARDNALSLLCRQGTFNEVRLNYYYISFVGKDGRGIVGIAKVGFNLRDPAGKGDPTKTYHFYEDGTSDCAVFVAG